MKKVWVEVKGIQGGGPQICILGAGSQKSPDHGDFPPPVLPSVSSPLPPLTDIKSMIDEIATCYVILQLILILHLEKWLTILNGELRQHRTCPKHIAVH